jgi:hypothetical protein
MRKYLYKILFIFGLLLLPLNLCYAASPAQKLKGRILLQVESVGQAWYVNPSDCERYYLADGWGAYKIMSDLGVGISNVELAKLQANREIAKKQSGKIFLQVQSQGQAYYVNFDGRLYYLKDAATAYSVMRSLGLGISNKDLAQIAVSPKSAVCVNNSPSQLVVTPAPALANGGTCTSWTYSVWSVCSSDGRQTRSIAYSFPHSCVGGSPFLSQACGTNIINYNYPTCSSWSYTDWGTCDWDGRQTRKVVYSYPYTCQGGSPILTQACGASGNDSQGTVNQICNSWSFSDWSDCNWDGLQVRKVLYSYPFNCHGGNPVLTQSCSASKPVCTSWSYTDWSACNWDRQQTRKVTASYPYNCYGGDPILLQNCY